MNRLRDATSPYLLQHADNPVDWYPWGDEAFARAREGDLPVLLSVGYAACHWCHVMAHESFEDPATAELMNEHFVNVKVDREERPDVDAVYMEATQAMTGHGGWPMTVFMTPDGAPIHCGTYYPREHFQRVLRAVARAWAEEREAIRTHGARIVTALTDRDAPATGDGPPGEDLLAAAVRGLAGSYDAARGGFGGAPKFPPSMVLEFLLRHHARTGDRPAIEMAGATLDAMARGGVYDQLAGGFARYSVDADWVVPHFEKMLYDNALLARVAAHWWRRTGLPTARRIAVETCAWMLAELRTEQGGFASALDADSEGEEGRYYVWTPGQLAEVLGADDGDYAARVFGVTRDGTFEHGSSVLQLRQDPDEPDRFARIRAALLAARGERVPPGRDDKVVTAWNGLAIAALAETGALVGRPDFVAAAGQAAALLLDLHVRDGRLVRTSRDGVAGATAGVLEDYADLAEGLLALHAVTGDPDLVPRAGALLDTVLDRFGDGRGGFYDTADDAERLIRRPRDPSDNAAPGGQNAAAGALLTYAALTGSARHREAAVAALAAVTPMARRYPRFAGWGMAVAEALVAGPVEIAVVGRADDPRTAELHLAALVAAPPGAAVSRGEPDGSAAARVPLLAGRGLVAGAPAAYVCRDFACEAPVTDPDRLRVLLGAPS